MTGRDTVSDCGLFFLANFVSLSSAQCELIIIKNNDDVFFVRVCVSGDAIFSANFVAFSVKFTRIFYPYHLARSIKKTTQ